MASTLAPASRRIQTCSNAASAPVTIFTSIRSVAESLHDVAPHLVTHVLEDDALRGRGGTVHFDPSALRPATQRALRHAEILVAVFEARGSGRPRTESNGTERQARGLAGR